MAAEASTSLAEKLASSRATSMTTKLECVPRRHIVGVGEACAEALCSIRVCVMAGGDRWLSVQPECACDGGMEA